MGNIFINYEKKLNPQQGSLKQMLNQGYAARNCLLITLTALTVSIASTAAKTPKSPDLYDCSDRSGRQAFFYGKKLFGQKSFDNLEPFAPRLSPDILPQLRLLREFVEQDGESGKFEVIYRRKKFQPIFAYRNFQLLIVCHLEIYG